MELKNKTESFWCKQIALKLWNYALVFQLAIATDMRLWWETPLNCPDEKIYYIVGLQKRTKTFEDGTLMKSLALFFFPLYIIAAYAATNKSVNGEQ